MDGDGAPPGRIIQEKCFTRAGKDRNARAVLCPLFNNRKDLGLISQPFGTSLYTNLWWPLQVVPRSRRVVCVVCGVWSRVSSAVIMAVMGPVTFGQVVME